jgi:hypothetical protein
MSRSPYWEPFAQAVMDAARLCGGVGFTVDEVALSAETPPQVRGSVLGALAFGGFIREVGRERSRRPERKSAKVARYVLDDGFGDFPGQLPNATTPSFSSGEGLAQFRGEAPSK